MANGLARGGQQQRGMEGRPAVAPTDPLGQLRLTLRGQMRRLEALFAGPHATELATRVCATAVIKYEELLLANPSTPPSIRSVVDAVKRAAQYGVEIAGDQAYLVPYTGKIQLIIGPGGLITMANREGYLCQARCVFEGDVFSYDLGTGHISHIKAASGRRPKGTKPEAMITHAYAKITRVTKRDEVAEPIIEVLTREDIAFYRSFSKASSGPWFDNYEGMARKTVLKRALANVPKGYLLSWAMNESDTGSALPVATAQGEEALDDFAGEMRGAVDEHEPDSALAEPMRQPGED